MNCSGLAQHIERISPDLTPTDVGRMTLLMVTAAESEGILMSELDDESVVRKLWKKVQFRYESAIDQHAAVADELAEFGGDATQFDPEQLWMLARALKVQSRVLEMYMGVDLVSG